MLQICVHLVLVCFVVTKQMESCILECASNSIAYYLLLVLRIIEACDKTLVGVICFSNRTYVRLRTTIYFRDPSMNKFLMSVVFAYNAHPSRASWIVNAQTMQSEVVVKKLGIVIKASCSRRPSHEGRHSFIFYRFSKNRLEKTPSNSLQS